MLFLRKTKSRAMVIVNIIIMQKQRNTIIVKGLINKGENSTYFRLVKRLPAFMFDGFRMFRKYFIHSAKFTQ